MPRRTSCKIHGCVEVGAQPSGSLFNICLESGLTHLLPGGLRRGMGAREKRREQERRAGMASALAQPCVNMTFLCIWRNHKNPWSHLTQSAPKAVVHQASGPAARGGQGKKLVSHQRSHRRGPGSGGFCQRDSICTLLGRPRSPSALPEKQQGEDRHYPEKRTGAWPSPSAFPPCSR